MARYVLLSRKKSGAQEDVERIKREPGVTVLDESEGRALLVEASEEAANRLKEDLEGWVIGSEVTHPRPGRPRQQVRSRHED